MTAAALDFDSYAEGALHFDVPFAFPKACANEMRKATGAYADLGAGDGAVLRSAFAQGLLERFDSVYAVDVSPVRIARIAAAPFPALTGLVADASAVPLPDASLGFIFSHQVIEHVPDDRAMAREIARLLQPGGRAFVTSVVKRWYGWYFYRCNGKWTLDPTHVREYSSLREYERVFTDAGLAIVDSRERQASHPLDKVAIWSLVRTHALPLSSARAVMQKPVMRALGRLAAPIPGYKICEVLLSPQR